ncbi:MAG: PTS sugar transporter subunit IIB [Olsenella sp.]|nr:PTS sugar transporter subunit IIB [Olsenella sp.]
MISQIRVDDRLIHGQVALVWSKELGVRHIVVANDHAATDDVTRMTLQMALPSGIKLLVKSVDDAIKIFNDPRAKDVSMFVLTNCVHDALRIVNECPNVVETVNAANIGRFDSTPNKTQLNACITLNDQELADLKELASSGVPTYAQVVPIDPKTPVAKLIKDAGK